MNTQQNEYIGVTTERYKELLEKEKTTPLTIAEMAEKKEYENYFAARDDLDKKGILPTSAQEEHSKETMMAMEFANKETRTPSEENIVQLTFKEQNQNQELEEPSRKLSKAGYVDATVILVVLLNLGFIIAMAILGR